jgi:hypothetical protein
MVITRHFTTVSEAMLLRLRKQHVPFLFVFLTKIANAVKAVKDIKEVIFHLFSLGGLQIMYF